jgi:carboxyl-terminal processing protease
MTDFHYATAYYYKTKFRERIPTYQCGLLKFQTVFKNAENLFDTETEQALKNTWQKEKIDGTIITEYQQLLSALQKRRNTIG